MTDIHNKKMPAAWINVFNMKNNGLLMLSSIENSWTLVAISEDGITIPSKKDIIRPERMNILRFVKLNRNPRLLTTEKKVTASFLSNGKDARIISNEMASMRVLNAPWW